MARKLNAIESFLREQISADPEEQGVASVPLSFRVDPQVIGDLEDMAGRLDMTRSQLARHLLEAALAEAEGWFDKHHQ